MGAAFDPCARVLPIQQRLAMTLLVLRPNHPAADLHDALDEPLWEGLAAAAVENVLVAATEPAVEEHGPEPCQREECE